MTNSAVATNSVAQNSRRAVVLMKSAVDECLGDLASAKVEASITDSAQTRSGPAVYAASSMQRRNYPD